MPADLSFEHIRKALDDDCDISIQLETDSTNEWILKQVRAGVKLPLACFAERQTKGRGRRGRAWISSPGASITMSLAWQFESPPSELGILSLAMGIAVIRTLEEAGIADAQLKWPNDVLVEGRKIAGILIETVIISEYGVVAVIGIGLNYCFPDTLAEVPDQPWTDVLTLASGDVDIDRSWLAGRLLHNCINVCRRYPRDRNQFVGDFREKYDACARKTVSVILADGERLEGVADGVTEQGEIRVLVDSELRTFNSAEISLRAIEPE